uniref:6-phosphogluconolactonase n=1 Tax=Plectus sambesii TaxID=2011161 RepID=A0A914V048_9BILA
MKVLYAGTYTQREPHVDGKGKGIYSFELNADIAERRLEVKPLGVTELLSPTFLAISSDKRHLLAVSETGDEVGNALTVYRIKEDGQLTKTSQCDAKGRGACYAAMTGDSFVLGANYNSGSAWVCALREESADRSVTAEMVGFAQLKHFTSVDPARQEAAHAHCAIALHGTNQVYVADLGADRIYQFDLGSKGELQASAVPHIDLPAGCGPRHLVIHPNGRFLFALCELSSTLLAFAIVDDADGHRTLKPVGAPMSTVAVDEKDAFIGPNDAGQNAAHVQMSPDGLFVYCSNRGVFNSIAIFRVDAHTGALKFVAHESSRGLIPRGFIIDPSGSMLFVANQNSDNIFPFWRDSSHGTLTFAGQEIHCPTPVVLEIVDI